MAADYTITFDSAKVPAPVVITGNPPADQTATIAAMQAAITKMKAAAKAGYDAVIAAAGPY